jgi:ataxia telangiectasia mutated family protein
MHIASAAQKCDLSYISLYYIETWYNEQIKSAGNHSLNINNLFKNEPYLITLIIDSYTSIGESEAISENLSFLNSILNKKHNFCNQFNEFNALFNYDNRLFANEVSKSFKNSDDMYNMLNSLKNCGMKHILNSFLKNNYNEKDDGNKLNDLKYECAKKLQNWDFDTDINDLELTYDKLIYKTVYTVLNETQSKLKLKSLYEKTQDCLMNNLSICSKTNLESTIINLYNLEQINHSLNIITNDFEILNTNLFSLEYNNFNLIDSIYSNRVLIFRSALNRENVNKNNIEISIAKTYEALIDNAIKHKRFQIGESYINEMKLLDFNQNTKQIIDYKHSLLLFEKNDFTMAKLLIKHAIDSVDLNRLSKDNQIQIEYYIKFLSLYASILDKIKCENPNKIIKDYLELSVETINKYKLNNKTIETDTYFKLAKFTDLQLQQVNNFINSSTFEEKQDLIKKFKSESKEIEKLEPNGKFYTILRSQLDIDEKELKILNHDKETYLCKSIENYLNCLEFGNDHDIHMFRLIALWTQNNTNIKVNKIIKSRILKIPTYKFVQLMYQLCARLKIVKGDLFYEILFELIFKTATDHPYHVS